MLKMKNAFLSSPSSSQFYTNGNADFQMLNRNVLQEMDHSLGFCMVNQLTDEDFANPYENSISHGHLDFPGSTLNCDRLAQQSEEDENVKRWRRGCGNKRIKTASSEEDSLPQPQHTTTKLPLPSRRNQKLGDKITVLQKLVSPYGKTNTAAVLEEACLYIKFLQQQIEQTLSSSYKTSTETQLQDDEERPTDLRRRGLCLVPVSFSRKVTADKHPTDFLDKIKVPRKF